MWASRPGSGEPDAFLAGQLDRIEREIDAAANRVKYAMNMAPVAIGGSQPKLTAIAAAGRIGPVKVDRGQTGCKTPEAIAYIAKMIQRKRGGRGLSSEV